MGFEQLFEKHGWRDPKRLRSLSEPLPKGWRKRHRQFSVSGGIGIHLLSIKTGAMLRVCAIHRSIVLSANLPDVTDIESGIADLGLELNDILGFDPR